MGDKRIQECKGSRNAIILYGGSGAGKTKNTKAIMQKLDEQFPSNDYHRKMGVTEIITTFNSGSPASIDIGTIDLLKEGGYHEGKIEKDKSCALKKSMRGLDER